MRHTNRVLAAAVVSALAATLGGGAAARGQVVIDGTRDATGYTQLAVQTANTGFGDSNNILGTSGSELDNLYYNVDLSTGRLNLFLGGNLETNNNKLVLFFDTYAGGQNTMRGDNPDVNFNNLNRRYGPSTVEGVANPGFTFDTGFEADHFLSISRDQGDGIDTFGSVYVDYAQLLTNGGGQGGYVGKISVPGIGTDQSGNGVPTDTDVFGGLPMSLGVNDNNTAGVNDNQGTAADQTAAAAVNTGAEFSIDLSALGIEGDVKIMAFINGRNHDFVSNQILAGLDPTQTNLGSDGLGNFKTRDDDTSTGVVSGVNLNNFAGNQYVTIPITIPTIAYSANADGNYSNGANFSGGVSPNGNINGRVLFGNAITGNKTVTIDTDVSLVRLTFDNTAGSYTLAGTNGITITGISATPAIRVLSGNHTISAPLTFNNDIRVSVAANSSLNINGTVNATGKNLFKVGAGTLQLPALAINSLSVNEGTLKLGESGNTVVRGATVSTGAILDLRGNALILDYDEGFSPLATLKQSAADGRIVSSTTVSGGARGVGYIDSAAFPALISYNNQPIDTTALVFRQTLLGDTNLDRTVNFDDLLALAKNYNSTSGEWYKGDFDYSGTVGFNDLLALAKNYNGSISASQSAELGSVAGDFALAQSLVPEPTVAFAGLMAGAAFMSRRRK